MQGQLTLMKTERQQRAKLLIFFNLIFAQKKTLRHSAVKTGQSDDLILSVIQPA